MARVRQQRRILRGLDDAEQVLDAPGAVLRVLPQRVPLEVEEDVPGGGSRYPPQRAASVIL
ncbi:hypothetical protein A5N15_03060 [Rothia kristinae]|uniref:Uncharacterized protein n=1 Tax=Rothia kristinae TaxID=37923 RepID=A0A657IWP8_9MICC|nr:hypothetical protein A5N15_03060 [Rothia kristinae]